MTLQTELDTLQKEKIADVLSWLEQFEAIISSAVPLSDDPGIFTYLGLMVVRIYWNCAQKHAGGKLLNTHNYKSTSRQRWAV